MKKVLKDRFMVSSVEVCKFFGEFSGHSYKIFIKVVNYLLQYENLDRKTTSFDDWINSKLFKIVCGAFSTIIAINKTPNPIIIQTDLEKSQHFWTFFVNK